jgi:hypothetical protein
LKARAAASNAGPRFAEVAGRIRRKIFGVLLGMRMERALSVRLAESFQISGFRF